ncbi:Mitogen-activated protein kinase 9 [Globodera pallida]|nr:Mitogen-activated protein kinase 9 [Globodera pallida]
MAKSVANMLKSYKISSTSTPTLTSSTSTSDDSGEIERQQFQQQSDDIKRVNGEMKSQRNASYGDKSLLARSEQGSVWKSIATEADGTKKCVTIKLLRAPFHSPGTAKYALREVALLSALNHPNLIALYDVRLPSKVKPLKKFDDLHLVTEYFGKNLRERIVEKLKNCTLWTHQELSYCIIQILCGVNYLHASGIVHRDLKPTNIVMSDRGNVKILDYGIARDIVPENLTTEAGTPIYRAPEIYLGIDSYDKKVDLWSVGCIFAELILARILFHGTTLATQWKLFNEVLGTPDLKFLDSLGVKETNKQIVMDMPKRESADWTQMIADNAVPKLISDYLTIENVRALLSSMLVLDPAQRTSAEQALKNAYFDIYRGYLSANLLATPQKVYCTEEFKQLMKDNNIDHFKEKILEQIATFKTKL